MKLDLTPAQRKWVYSVSASLMPLLITLGVITGGVAQQILAVIAAVLGVGSATLAYKNVDPKK